MFRITRNCRSGVLVTLLLFTITLLRKSCFAFVPSFAPKIKRRGIDTVQERSLRYNCYHHRTVVLLANNNSLFRSRRVVVQAIKEHPFQPLSSANTLFSKRKPSRTLARLKEGVGNNNNGPPPRSQQRGGSNLGGVPNNNNSNIGGGTALAVNPVLQEASRLLKRTSWFSWWAQTILTVISCTILLFASNATKANRAANPPSFFLSALGLTVSFISILWTWGNGTRLSRRLLRDKSTPVMMMTPHQSSPPAQQPKRPLQKSPKQQQSPGRNFSFLPAAPGELLRRAIRVQLSLNLVGLFLTLLAAEEIVGSLALKVLTAGSAFGSVYGAGATTPVGFIQPLDVLIVQANTNILLSHFASLTCSLYLADRVGLFQPQQPIKQQPQQRN
ncbi:hypothetical protein ACA910_000339 [Epithemia clementina (nom. ined.)]